jgi:GTPase SAR1 family protein
VFEFDGARYVLWDTPGDAVDLSPLQGVIASTQAFVFVAAWDRMSSLRNAIAWLAAVRECVELDGVPLFLVMNKEDLNEDGVDCEVSRDEFGRFNFPVDPYSGERFERWVVSARSGCNVEQLFEAVFRKAMVAPGRLRILPPRPGPLEEEELKNKNESSGRCM